MNEITIKYISIISAIIFGSLLFFALIYKLSQSGGTGYDKSKSKSKSYKKSLSLDKLYDEAGGNDALSDARMTNKIDISTQDNSCGFMVTYKGVRDRTVECISGCDEGDDNSDFCKQFVYGGSDDGLKKDTLLDETFIRRRDSASKSETESVASSVSSGKSGKEYSRWDDFFSRL